MKNNIVYLFKIFIFSAVISTFSLPSLSHEEEKDQIGITTTNSGINWFVEEKRLGNGVLLQSFMYTQNGLQMGGLTFVPFTSFERKVQNNVPLSEENTTLQNHFEYKLFCPYHDPSYESECTPNLDIIEKFRLFHNYYEHGNLQLANIFICHENNVIKELNKTGENSAICEHTSHYPFWIGPCRDRYEDALEDAKNHNIQEHNGNNEAQAKPYCFGINDLKEIAFYMRNSLNKNDEYQAVCGYKGHTNVWLGSCRDNQQDALEDAKNHNIQEHNGDHEAEVLPNCIDIDEIKFNYQINTMQNSKMDNPIKNFSVIYMAKLRNDGIVHGHFSLQNNNTLRVNNKLYSPSAWEWVAGYQ